MTEPHRQASGAQVAEMIGATERLRISVLQLMHRLDLFKIGLMLTAFGLLFDLALSGLFSRFFAAETDKVAGQIVGERRQLTAERLIMHNPRRGLVEFQRGTEQWIQASQRYLDTIRHLNVWLIVAWSITALGLALIAIGFIRRVIQRRQHKVF